MWAYQEIRTLGDYVDYYGRRSLTESNWCSASMKRLMEPSRRCQIKLQMDCVSPALKVVTALFTSVKTQMISL